MMQQESAWFHQRLGVDACDSYLVYLSEAFLHTTYLARAVACKPAPYTIHQELRTIFSL